MARRVSDDTDRLVERWTALVPEIDQRVERVVDRLLISARYLDRLAGSLAAPHDIQAPDYEILARLFWVGPPHRLRPTQLAVGTMTAPTTVTSRLVRLERRGLIQRVADPADRRVLDAQLTESGQHLFIRIVAEQARVEHEIFSGMAAADLDRLAELLRVVMTLLEEHLGPAPRRVSLALSSE